MKHENFVLSNELIKVELPPRKIWKADGLSVSPSSERRAKPRNVSFSNLSRW